MKALMHKNSLYLATGTMVLAGMLLTINTFADGTDVVDKISITVPVSCTMSGTGMNTHNAEITNGTYNSAIGETTLKAFCNDNEGFAIYAIGYTDNLNGKNVLTSSVLGSTHDIITGTSTTGANSNWAMKLSTVSSPVPTYPIIIAGSSDDTERESGDPDFTSFQQIPNDYTLVAKRTGGTDIGTNAEGSTLKTTYQSYISKTQPAGTYTGQVKYTLIHPHDEPTPPSSMLLTGSEVNIKMKSLAAGTSKAFTDQDNSIKAIKMANSLPANFEAMETNTVSTPDSKYPIYIFFDNTNDAGIMYFYTENDTVVMNPDSSNMFVRYNELSDISGLSNWNAHNVTTTQNMFFNSSKITDISSLSNWDTSNIVKMGLMFCGLSGLTSVDALENWDISNVDTLAAIFYNNESLTDISALANWDTSSVRNMSLIFDNASSLIDISALANWDTSNVISMNQTFTGLSNLTDTSPLMNWDTSNVEDMSFMFANDDSISTIDVSSWDTSNVVTMQSMFGGDGQLTEIIGLSDLDVSNVTNMTGMFYGVSNMTHYDIADWDVSKVESFNHMFCDNYNLESLDLSKWDVSSVKTMYDMFDDNYKLTTIGDVSHWNTINLIDIGGWLNGAGSFVGDNGTLDLSGWNTSNLKSSGEVFRATKLQTIDLSGWSFDSISNSGWDGAGSGIYYEYGNGDSVYNGFGGMFKNASLLTTVYVSQFGLNSFNAAINNGINTTDMWTGSGVSGFTVK